MLIHLPIDAATVMGDGRRGKALVVGCCLLVVSISYSQLRVATGAVGSTWPKQWFTSVEWCYQASKPRACSWNIPDQV